MKLSKKKWILLSVAALLVLVLGTFAWAFFSLPQVEQLKSCYTTHLYKVRVCPGDKNYVKLSQISNITKRAILVSEDGTFYSHEGFDWFELKQSFIKNLKSMEYARGGSTITQQLAKNAFLTSEKSLTRKLLEAYLAKKLEEHFTKDQILEKYLNMVEFGPKLFGIKPASLKYFGKPPSQIHLLEAVWLAHLLPNPKVYSRGMTKGHLSPYSRERVQILLQRLLKYGDITRAQFQFAKSQIDNFPWTFLTQEDFDNAGFDQQDQQRALEELMNSEDWINEEHPSHEGEDSEDFNGRS